MGNSVENLSICKRKIEGKFEVESISSVYRTEAWGIRDQPDFMNQGIKIKSDLNPKKLLQSLESIENEMGKSKIMKWGPRLIDIDILYYNDIILITRFLTIPHLQISKRRFTLSTMAELAPEFIHPVLNISQQQLLSECPDVSRVEKIG
jgi:2-amino-4-hydroxy-6-hydroxymethyldihydropteridine diphosphokinase